MKISTDIHLVFRALFSKNNEELGEKGILGRPPRPGMPGSDAGKRRAMTIRCITPAEAFHHCDPLEFTFETTAEVESLTRFIGQERALEAVDFGVGMRQSGFNLFVIGAEGSGRHSVIKSFINKKAAEEETPKDWCYLHNFKHPHRPLAVAFPFGHSLVFKREMHDLVDKLKSTIPTVFEGDDYRARSKVVRDKLQHKVEKLYHAVEERAKADNIAVIKGEQGVLFAPMDNDGRPIETKEFLRKPEPERKQIEKKIEKYPSIQLHQDASFEMQKLCGFMSHFYHEYFFTVENIIRGLSFSRTVHGLSGIASALVDFYTAGEHREPKVFSRYINFLSDPMRDYNAIDREEKRILLESAKILHSIHDTVKATLDTGKILEEERKTVEKILNVLHNGIEDFRLKDLKPRT